jgi:hypothetical protein
MVQVGGEAITVDDAIHKFLAARTARHLSEATLSKHGVL